MATPLTLQTAAPDVWTPSQAPRAPAPPPPGNCQCSRTIVHPSHSGPLPPTPASCPLSTESHPLFPDTSFNIPDLTILAPDPRRCSPDGSYQPQTTVTLRSSVACHKATCLQSHVSNYLLPDSSLTHPTFPPNTQPASFFTSPPPSFPPAPQPAPHVAPLILPAQRSVSAPLTLFHCWTVGIFRAPLYFFLPECTSVFVVPGQFCLLHWTESVLHISTHCCAFSVLYAFLFFFLGVHQCTYPIAHCLPRHSIVHPHPPEAYGAAVQCSKHPGCEILCTIASVFGELRLAMNALPVVRPLWCNAFGGGPPCLKKKSNGNAQTLRRWAMRVGEPVHEATVTIKAATANSMTLEVACKAILPYPTGSRLAL